MMNKLLVLTASLVVSFIINNVHAAPTPSSKKNSAAKPVLNSITDNLNGPTVLTADDGTRIIQNQDGSKVQISPDGSLFISNADGTTIQKNADGS